MIGTAALKRFEADLLLANRYALAARSAAERGDDLLAGELRQKMDAIFDRIEEQLP
jgi:hypothetical protein